MQVDKPTLEQLEERYIKLILKEVNYKKDEAAKRLGVSMRTLYRKEKIYGLTDENEGLPQQNVNAINQVRGAHAQLHS